MSRKTSSKTIKSTGTAFDIIETLATQGEMTITEIAERVDVSKSTVHTHLTTLEGRGYVIKTDSNRYRAGLRFLSIGGAVRDSNYKRLYKTAKPEVDELAETTEERAQLMVEENDYGYYLYQAAGRRAVETDSHVGKQVPLHSTAVGKAYLANVSSERLDSFLDKRTLVAHTDSTINDRESLLDELETVRNRGLAFDNGERVSGVRCVAAPIEDDMGSVIGAISVSGPANRMQGDRLTEEIGQLVQNAARVIGLNATYS